MKERLLSAVRRAWPPRLKELLTPDSGGESSVERERRETAARDRKGSSKAHVLSLLETNGGRMWQQRIVSETGYSEPQISRLLCELEEEGVVERKWRGGEKVVILEAESIESERSAPTTAS